MTQTEAFEILKKTPVAYVTDAMRRIGISCYPRGISLLQDRLAKTMVGRAVTMGYIPRQPGKAPLAFGQFDAARACGEGDILVFAACGTLNWVTGGNVGEVVRLQGASGMIVDGCIRDSVELKERDLPVYATGKSAKPYGEDIQLAVFNEPVNFGGVMIHPGDVIVGDEDGLAVIPKDRFDDVMYQLGDIPDIESRLSAAVENRAPVAELSAIFKEKHPPRA